MGTWRPATPMHPDFPHWNGISIDGPDHVWGTDITYIAKGKGFLFLTAVMDRYPDESGLRDLLADQQHPGHVVLLGSLAWSPSATPAPRIFNTDQGSQYTIRIPKCLAQGRHRSTWTGKAVPPTTPSSSGSGAASSSSVSIATAPTDDGNELHRFTCALRLLCWASAFIRGSNPGKQRALYGGTTPIHTNIRQKCV